MCVAYKMGNFNVNKFKRDGNGYVKMAIKIPTFLLVICRSLSSAVPMPELLWCYSQLVVSLFNVVFDGISLSGF
jgi:hypothetical protein